MSARKREINRQDAPPPQGRVPRLVVIRPGRGSRLICCSAGIWGCQTHWNPVTKRTVQCTKPTKLCAGHNAGMPQRWKGAITVITEGGGEPFFLDLTGGAGEMLLKQKGEQSLRGKILLVQRETYAIRSPLLVDIVGEHPQPDTLPTERDPLETLLKIWGLTEI